MFVKLGWKACQGQKLQLITKIRKLWTKKFYNIGHWKKLCQSKKIKCFTEKRSSLFCVTVIQEIFLLHLHLEGTSCAQKYPNTNIVPPSVIEIKFLF